jgi:tetratricopeptide (TPR) repeat protein
MQKNFLLKLAISIACAAIIGAAVYVQYMQWVSIDTQPSTSTEASSTPQVVTPDYTQPISFSGNLSSDIKAELTQELKKTQQIIKTSPLDLKAWLNLGTVYKIGGDYEHARIAWEFITEVAPGSVSQYFNLGDLYMNYLKDYPKAESNYKKVIDLRPGVIDVYQNLYYLYLNSYKTDTSAARDILELGLKNNPGNPTLTTLLAEYNKNHE